MSELLFSSLLALCVGSLLSLPLISVREIGRGFFTLWVAVILLLGGIAILLGYAGIAGSAARAAGGGLFVVLGVCLGLLLPFWLFLRWGQPGAATVLLVLSAVAGGAALRDLALGPAMIPGQGVLGAALRVASLLLSALAVGMVTVTMVLGHWYLVQPKLAIAPLRRLCDVLIGILLARLIVAAWGFAVSVRGGFRFFGGADPLPWEALILSQRLLFVFGGALILAIMIRKTVALRSTMAATGLLYIAILFVWVGEFLSIYLGHLTHGGLIV